MQVWDVLPAIAPGVLPSPGEYDYKAHGFLPTAADIAGKEVARKIFEFFAEHSVYGEQKGGIGLYSVLQELGYDYGAGILDLLVAENADHPELRAALPGEQTFTGMIKEQH